MATDLDQFRADARAWLEANCPPEMRQPIRSEKDFCWGGRHWTFQSDAQRQWLEVMAERKPQVLPEAVQVRAGRWQ